VSRQKKYNCPTVSKRKNVANLYCWNIREIKNNRVMCGMIDGFESVVTATVKQFNQQTKIITTVDGKKYCLQGKSGKNIKVEQEWQKWCWHHGYDLKSRYYVANKEYT
jgi:hypothetical protein